MHAIALNAQCVAKGYSMEGRGFFPRVSDQVKGQKRAPPKFSVSNNNSQQQEETKGYKFHGR